jgi:hypothetical protein
MQVRSSTARVWKVPIVLTILVGCAAIAWGVRWVIIARTESARGACISNLKTIQGAKDTWALEFKKTTNDVATDSDLFGDTKYIREKPVCPEGGVYSIGRVGSYPTCSIGGPSHSMP